jgi:hypothetical protein
MDRIHRLEEMTHRRSTQNGSTMRSSSHSSSEFPISLQVRRYFKPKASSLARQISGLLRRGERRKRGLVFVLGYDAANDATHIFARYINSQFLCQALQPTSSRGALLTNRPNNRQTKPPGSVRALTALAGSAARHIPAFLSSTRWRPRM